MAGQEAGGANFRTEGRRPRRLQRQLPVSAVRASPAPRPSAPRAASRAGQAERPDPSSPLRRQSPRSAACGQRTAGASDPLSPHEHSRVALAWCPGQLNSRPWAGTGPPCSWRPSPRDWRPLGRACRGGQKALVPVLDGGSDRAFQVQYPCPPVRVLSHWLQASRASPTPAGVSPRNAPPGMALRLAFASPPHVAWNICSSANIHGGSNGGHRWSIARRRHRAWRGRLRRRLYDLIARRAAARL